MQQAIEMAGNLATQQVNQTPAHNLSEQEDKSLLDTLPPSEESDQD